MSDLDKLDKTPGLWLGEPDIVIRQALLKLAEEADELATAATRCALQGLDEKEPETGKSNRLWLEEELADVDALENVLRRIVARRHSTPIYFLPERVKKKVAHKLEWLDMVAAATR